MRPNAIARSARSANHAVAPPSATTSTLPSVLIRPLPVARCKLANGSLAPTLTRSARARGNSTADGAIRPACIPLRASVPPPFRCVPVLPGRNAPRPGLGGLVPRPPAPQTGAPGVAAFSGSTVTPLSSGFTPAPRSIPAVRLSPTARPSGSQRVSPKPIPAGETVRPEIAFRKKSVTEPHRLANQHGPACVRARRVNAPEAHSGLASYAGRLDAPRNAANRSAALSLRSLATRKRNARRNGPNVLMSAPHPLRPPSLALRRHCAGGYAVPRRVRRHVRAVRHTGCFAADAQSDDMQSVPISGRSVQVFRRPGASTSLRSVALHIAGLCGSSRAPFRKNFLMRRANQILAAPSRHQQRIFQRRYRAGQ